MNSASCSKPGCPGKSAAWLAYDYRTRSVWIDDRVEGPSGSAPVGGAVDGSTRWPLCERHATSLRVPRGWSRVDRRAAAPDFPLEFAELGPLPAES